MPSKKQRAKTRRRKERVRRKRQRENVEARAQVPGRISGETTRQRDAPPPERLRRSELAQATRGKAGGSIDDVGVEDQLERTEADGVGSIYYAEEGRGGHEKGRVSTLRSVDTLGIMLKAGTIGPAHARAGRRFTAAFRRCNLASLKAVPLSPFPASRKRGPQPVDEADEPMRLTEARAYMAAAIQALGGAVSQGGLNAPMVSVCWFVLGQGHSIRQWALTIRFCSEKTGERLLRAALTELAALDEGRVMAEAMRRSGSPAPTAPAA